MPSPTSRSIASTTWASDSGTITSPVKSMRSSISAMRSRGTMGRGLLVTEELGQQHAERPENNGHCQSPYARRVISAEAAYHSAAGGVYAALACLLAPTGAGCIPNYPPTAPTFIDSLIGSMSSKSGYSRTMDESAAVPGGLALLCLPRDALEPGPDRRARARWGLQRKGLHHAGRHSRSVGSGRHAAELHFPPVANTVLP